MSLGLPALSHRLGLGLAVSALLAGCATPPATRPLDGPLLSGRLSLRIDSQPPRSLSTGFELTGDAQRGRLVLAGPLGTVAAQAQWAPGSATLTTGDARTEYPDLDRLAADALGEAVPLAALFDWLRGRPWPGAPAQPRDDGQAGFVQLGWTVSTARLAEGWIEARRDAPPTVTVRARLDDAGATP